MKNKGQTAMEYLMTYGWAILIIIVVVAALYAMGVFSIKGSVTCSPCFSYFAFVDYSQTAGTLRIRNGARTIEITSVVSTPDAGATTADCAAGTPCDAGNDIDITSFPNTAGTTETLTVTYTDM